MCANQSRKNDVCKLLYVDYISYHELIECVEQLVVPIPTTLLITTLGGGVQVYSLVSSTFLSLFWMIVGVVVVVCALPTSWGANYTCRNGGKLVCCATS